MDEAGKEFYNAIDDMVSADKLTCEVDVSNLASEDVHKSFLLGYAVYLAENPWASLYFDTKDIPTETISGNIYTLSFEKSSYSEFNKNYARANYNKIVKTVGNGSRYEMIARLTTYIGKNFHYDYEDAYSIGGVGSYSSHEIMGPLLRKWAVCEGFTYLVKAVCDEKNIPCLCVEFETTGEDHHMANYILMEDGKWYLYDGTGCENIVNNYEECGNQMLIGEYGAQGSSNYFGKRSVGIGICDSNITVPGLAEDLYESPEPYDWESYNEAELEFEFGEPKFLYDVNNDNVSCTITGYEGEYTKDLVIPEMVDGYQVTSIGDRAFYYCTDFSGNLVIPDTVETIGEYAFCYCTGLDGELVLSKNIKEIGYSAFMNCNQLKGRLLLPEGIKTIGGRAFYLCKGFEGNLELPESLTTLGGSAFCYCIGFTGDFKLPANITSYDDFVEGCTGFDGTIYLPNSYEFTRVDYWGNAKTGFSAFHVEDDNPRYTVIDGVVYDKDVQQLVICPRNKKGTLSILNSVKSIGDYACQYSEINELKLPSSIEKIGKYAFFACKNLNGTLDLSILTKTPEIGHQAFSDCNYEAINFGDTFSVVPASFQYMNSLEDVYFGSNVTSIIGDPFYRFMTGKSINLFFAGNPPTVENSSLIGEDDIVVFFQLGNASWNDEYFGKFSANTVWVGLCDQHLDDKSSAYLSCRECCMFKFVNGNKEIIHVWNSDYTVDKKATCTEEGSKSIHCKKCDEIKDRTVIAATGHSYGEWKEVKSPSCTDKGSKERVCGICGDKETVEVEEKGHTWNSDYTVDKKATCTEEGSKSIHCKKCDEIKDCTVIAATGHNYGEWKEVKSPSYTDKGSKERVCKTCGHKETVEVPKLIEISGGSNTGSQQNIPTGSDLSNQQNTTITALMQKITTAKIKTYKASKLKKKKVTFSLKAKTSGDGKLTYKVTKYPKGMKKYISVSKKGKVTLEKKAKKGTYKITITASKTSKYKKAKRVIIIKVK